MRPLSTWDRSFPGRAENTVEPSVSGHPWDQKKVST